MTDDEHDIPPKKVFESLDEAVSACREEYRLLLLWDWKDRNLTLDAFFDCFDEIMRHSSEDKQLLHTSIEKLQITRKECLKILDENNWGGFG